MTALWIELAMTRKCLWMIKIRIRENGVAGYEA
jgi:hypothetical protein